MIGDDRLRYTVHPILRVDDHEEVDFKTCLLAADHLGDIADQAVKASREHAHGVIIIDRKTGEAWSPRR